jgi:hypothetical protein
MGGWIIGTVWLFYLLGVISRVIDFIAWLCFAVQCSALCGHTQQLDRHTRTLRAA